MAEGPRPGPPPRVPPNNLQAEESVLGAMILSREAIAEVVEILDPDHFYKPAHAHLFDAILSLYSGGEPVDAVTVADELTRAGLLDEIGGPAVLLDLQATTPAISNAAHYAKIVEEHALLRRMITVSNEIAETAYTIPDDVTKAVDDAESRMFDVAQRRVANTMAPIKDLLPANLDRIEMLYDRGEAITGLSTGYLDLDERLAGLQPSALYVVGARPAMGKALALDTPLATPTGWTTMGDVGVGATVFDERGQQCSVTYKSPVFIDHDCYEVEFDDGSVIVADSEHQWFTWDHKAWKSRRARFDLDQSPPPAHPDLGRDQSHKRSWPAVRTTREIAATLRVGVDQRPNHRIPVAAALDLPDAELPLDPYLLGLWLGDGHSGRPQITTMDKEILAAFRLEGWNPFPNSSQNSGRGATYTIRHDEQDGMREGQIGGRTMLAFTKRLRDVGLWKTAKHIPRQYLRSSYKQRLALLKGLMDTDGTVVRGRTTCQLALSNERLLLDARELVLSLGYKAGRINHRRSNSDTDVWILNFSAPESVFRLTRKTDVQRLADRPNGKTRWRTIVGVRQVDSVATQCITVSSPSHLYLAGLEMIPTHNTAFALGLAANSAMKDDRPVLIFTLEMSQLELSQRLLCSDALVDASRVKTGRLEEGEWNRISHAVGRLAEAPIYIDDNPHTSVMDIRAKARRLKSRAGDLGMVVVDYIQLMTGRSNAESRQVEVSEISRNLKILARELDAPVVALAQLNRGLEQRTDKRPMLSDLRESGCLPASTRILSADGTEVTLGELLLSQETPDVWAIDSRGRVVSRRLVRTFPSGRKPVFRMRLASGRQVDATDNHRFLTIDGWAHLRDINLGTELAVPRALPEPVDAGQWPEAEVVLLAHLLGDGSVVNSVRYASIDEANIEAVYGAVRHFGCEATLEGAGTAKRTGAVQVWVPSPHRLTHGRHHPIRDWLDGLGVWGKRSHEKTIPEDVHQLPTKQVALFLHHLWATDGSVTIARNNRGALVRCYYSTTSVGLARGVQRLLQRFEIRSTVSLSKKSGYRPCYQVRLQGQPDLLRFMTEIGCHGARGGRVPEAIEILNGITPNSGDQELVDVATSDIYWDEVVEIEPLGVQPVFDATVADDHNFIANGIIAHNSLEQDADVVLFLYRDEVYDENSPEKGVAEVIIAKHRNGPTGKTRLAFRGQFTRFDNMARSMPPGGGPSYGGGSSEEF